LTSAIASVSRSAALAASSFRNRSALSAFSLSAFWLPGSIGASPPLTEAMSTVWPASLKA
jgi:hypothetical protein